MPLWESAALIVLIPTLIAMGGPFLIRRLVGYEFIAPNNEVAGFKFATLGVIYAVLLGFTVVVVWERFSDAERASVQEAAAILTMHRLSAGLPADSQAKLHAELSSYVEAAIADDWPEMARGAGSRKVTQKLDDMYAAVLAIPAATPRDTILLEELFNQLNSVTEARRERLILADGIVPNVIWLVLFAGAVVTLTFTFFFGSRNLVAQVLMTGMLAALIFMALFVAVEIDHPFSGAVSVPPQALRLIDIS
jgi:hypothetical protein